MYTGFILNVVSMGFEKVRNLIEIFPACSAQLFILPFGDKTFSKPMHMPAQTSLGIVFILLYKKTGI
jgi:hypothetical protein